MYNHRKFVEIDRTLDEKPTKKKIIDLVELRNRNLLAFEELDQFNRTGTFLYKHPLIIKYSLRNELLEILRRDPGEFMELFANARDNVKRYSSFLKSTSRSDEQKAKDRENLVKHEERVAVFKEVMEESVANEN